VGNDLELEAWAYNALSIAYGKLEAHEQYVACTRQAIEKATAVGNHWLAATVTLRDLHKQSWAAAEAGSPLENGLFQDAVNAQVAYRGSKVATGELNHLRAQRDAYLALHYTWQVDEWDSAERAIVNAERRFSILGDQPELTRMVSERGRLFLLGYDDKEASLALLREGLGRRVNSGELARARYDLVWLGQAHAAMLESQSAEICMWAALAVHESLYSGKPVDKGIVSSAARYIGTERGDVVRSIGKAEAGKPSLLALLQSATGLSAADCVALVNVDRLHQMILHRSD
jgi:hypothetical protein